MTYLLLGLWTYLVITVLQFDQFRTRSVTRILTALLLILVAWPLIWISTFLYHVLDLSKEKSDEQP